MSRSRYTRQSLYADLKDINKGLIGTGYYLAANGRNGYTGVDEYVGDASEGTGGRCVRNIKCGTPRECLEAALEYEAPEPRRELKGTQKSPFGPF